MRTRLSFRHSMNTRHTVPDKDQINLLEPFDRLGLDRIRLVATAEHAHEALAEMAGARVLGFDTESKPTFLKNEVSQGPHVVQLATLEKAWIFQLHDAECRAVVAGLLARAGVVKAGFGLGDDRKRIVAKLKSLVVRIEKAEAEVGECERRAGKLGVEPADVLELNTVFRERGWRKDMGVKAAVAVLFNRRFIKSRKATTSNWANPRLTEAQLVYAANDAYAAVRVFHELGLA